MSETVAVSDWMMQIAEDLGQPISPVLGEVEAEMLFYALGSLTVDVDEAPLFYLKFEWPEAYYCTSFFVTLLGFIVDSPNMPYFAQLITMSDMCRCAERARLVDIAWDRLDLDSEVLA